MANDFIPHICGHNRIYVPDRSCTDCERLEARVTALERIVEKKVTISHFNRSGGGVTAEVIGEVVD